MTPELLLSVLADWCILTESDRASRGQKWGLEPKHSRIRSGSSFFFLPRNFPSHLQKNEKSHLAGYLFQDNMSMCCYSGYGFQNIQSRTQCINHENFMLEQGIKFCNTIVFKYCLDRVQQFFLDENWFDWVLMYINFF